MHCDRSLKSTQYDDHNTKYFDVMSTTDESLQSDL